MSLEGAIAVTRFGLGARKGEIEAASHAPKDWLLRQLKPNNSSHAAFKDLKPSHEIYSFSRKYKTERKKLDGDALVKASSDYGKAVRQNFYAEIKARSLYAAQTDAPFHERLTRFWSNHFSVSARNRNTRLFPGAYEREAIRPRILGSFYELAVSAIFHPAMIVFLDNDGSVGPNSPRGKRNNIGLNENLAREALELHTVTPAADYSQADVTEFAKALTGWRIERRDNDGRKQGHITFHKNSHEPGTREVLGKRYKEKEAKQALAILKDLCARPETAQNVAHKLAAHLVSDEPPKALVAALKEEYLKTNGDLSALYKTLISSPLAWEPAAQKVKSPEELILSAARLIGFENVISKRPRDTYDSLAQLPFTAPTPEGWPDKARDWLGPDALLKRVEWANELASHMPNTDGRAFLKSALGARLSPETLQAVARAESGQQAFAMALLSPEFQRR